MPDEDIKIRFSGMRPGEKLYKELSSLLEDTVPTEHEKIRNFMGDGTPGLDTQQLLNSFHEICESRDVGRSVVALKEPSGLQSQHALAEKNHRTS